jgi:hypothetical protein
VGLAVSYTYGLRDWDEPGLVRGPGSHILACVRTPVARLMKHLPARYIEALEQNQQIAHCCRHPENHDIEAWYSCEEERQKGVPDIYILHCTCGRQHRRFCVGWGERPAWETR